MQQEKRLAAQCRHSAEQSSRYANAVRGDWEVMCRDERRPLAARLRQEEQRLEGQYSEEVRRCERDQRLAAEAVAAVAALQARSDAARHDFLAGPAARCEALAERQRRRRDETEEAAKQVWLATAVMSVNAGFCWHRSAKPPDVVPAT